MLNNFINLNYFIMKKTVLLIIITGLFLACEVSAQVSGDTLWTRTYGGQENDLASCVKQTNDNGYIIAGSTASFGAGGSDAYLVKTNSSGDTLWTKTYGFELWEESKCVQQTSDGGYVIAGKTNSFSETSDPYVVKTDYEGNCIWEKIYGGEAHQEEIYSIVQTNDNGFAICGRIVDYGTPEDFYILRIDADGDTLWTKRYGNFDDADVAHSIKQTDDGGFIIAGYTLSYQAMLCSVWLIKTDSNGDIVWEQTYSEPGYDMTVASCIHHTSEGGFIMSGYVMSFSVGTMDAYAIKIDSTGNTIWSKTYGGMGDDFAFSIDQTFDDGFIMCGQTNSFGTGDADVYLIRTNSLGDTLWTRTYGGSQNDEGHSVQQTVDGNFIVTGTKHSEQGSYDMWLLKVAGESQSPLNPPQNLFVTEKAYASWDAPSSKDLLGYNIFLDGDFVEYTTDLFYQYIGLINEQTHIAGVSAVYDEGESEIIEYEFTCIFTGIESNIIPDTELLGNFPNPFSSSTTISFSVEDSDKNTMITVYNFNGQKIRTLVNKKLSAGTHQIVWDGTNDSGNPVSSGIYFYKMVCGDKYTGFKKMILMK